MYKIDNDYFIRLIYILYLRYLAMISGLYQLHLQVRGDRSLPFLFLLIKIGEL